MKFIMISKTEKEKIGRISKENEFKKQWGDIITEISNCINIDKIIDDLNNLPSDKDFIEIISKKKVKAILTGYGYHLDRYQCFPCKCVNIYDIFEKIDKLKPVFEIIKDNGYESGWNIIDKETNIRGIFGHLKKEAYYVIQFY